MNTIVYWRVHKSGYEIVVMRGRKVLEEYRGGNHPMDSQAYLDLEDPMAYSQDKLRKNAVKTAEEMAEEYGTDLIEEDDSFGDDA